MVHYLGGMKEEEGMKDDCEMLIQQTQEAVLQDKRRDTVAKRITSSHTNS